MDVASTWLAHTKAGNRPTDKEVIVIKIYLHLPSRGRKAARVT